MTYDPSIRISARNALSHPYFQGVKLVPPSLPEFSVATTDSYSS